MKSKMRKEIRTAPGDTYQNWPKMRKWLEDNGHLRIASVENRMQRFTLRATKGNPHRIRRRTITRRYPAPSRLPSTRIPVERPSARPATSRRP